MKDRIFAFLLCLTLIPVTARSQDAPVSCRGPLSEVQLQKLISGKVAQSRLIQLVTTCGIDFVSDSATESNLKTAGASTALLAVVRWLRFPKDAKVPGADVHLSDKAPDTGTKLGPRLLESPNPKLETNDVAATVRKAGALDAAPQGSRAGAAFLTWLHAVAQGDFSHMDQVAAAGAAFGKKIRSTVPLTNTDLFDKAEKALKENRADDAVELFIADWAYFGGRLPANQKDEVIGTVKRQTGLDLSEYGDRVLQVLGTLR
jgi:hypothetical protein